MGAKVESNFNVMEMMLLCSIINVYPYRCVANVVKYLFTEVLHEFSETEWEGSEPLPKSVAILFRFVCSKFATFMFDACGVVNK